MINKGPGAGWPTEGTKNSCALDSAPGQGWEARFSPPWPLVPSLWAQSCWGCSTSGVISWGGGPLVCPSAYIGIHIYPFILTGI